MTMINETSHVKTLGQLIPWLEDETLFSWCSRYHQLTANSAAQATVAQLFGRANIRCVDDFPTHISALAGRAGGSLGSVEHLIQHRTILPFYLTFKSSEVGHAAVTALSGVGSSSLKYRLGLLTSGLGAAHPLKACAHCLSDDLLVHRTAYWRLPHQLPGVWVCPKHGIALQIQSRDLRPSRRFRWLLPSHIEMSSVPCVSNTAFDSPPSLLIRMAECSLRAHAEPAARFADAGRIARAFRLQLSNRGWLTTGGSVKWKIFHDELCAFVKQSAAIPQFALSATPRLGQVQLARLLAGRALTHTLRYLLWICFVFECWESFKAAFDACDEIPSDIAGTVTARRPGGDLSAKQVAAVEMLQSGQKSMTAIAAALGVCPSTVASWAAKAGITTARRPKKLKDDVYSQAQSLLEKGSDKQEVCACCGISVATVTRILRNVPGLQARWHSTRKEISRANARATWLLVAKSYKEAGTAARRALAPSVYAWLYRNDLIWLRATEQQQPNLTVGNHAPRRILRADEQHAQSLAAWLHSSTGAIDPAHRLAEMVSSVPALRKVALAPQDWPATFAVVRGILQTVHSELEVLEDTSQLKLI